MKISKLLPSNVLRPYISRYWVWEKENTLPKIFAGTGTELMFRYGATLSTENVKGNVFSLPKSYIMSPRFKQYQLQVSQDASFISVRFRAGAFRHFCQYAGSDFIDNFVSCEDLWGQMGKSLEQQVFVAQSTPERVRVIEGFLIECLNRYVKDERKLDCAVQSLLYHYQDMNVQQIQQNLFLSQRQMERKFKAAVGVSPKAFQRISRFEAVIKKLLLARQNKYLDIAMEHGYYDQSHFIKDFKYYIGEAPSVFLQNKNFMSHFYNEKLLR